MNKITCSCVVQFDNCFFIDFTNSFIINTKTDYIQENLFLFEQVFYGILRLNISKRITLSKTMLRAYEVNDSSFTVTVPSTRIPYLTALSRGYFILSA